MTQARGPWIGAVVGFGIASVGRARFPLRRALLLGVLGITVGIPAYLAVKQYTSGPRTDFGSEKETAQYRAELIDNYVPVAEAGGAWGWGRSFPIIGGQLSIDNDFLLVWLVQGSVGIGSLLLLYFESAVKFFRVGLKTRSFQDRYLVFSLLGILVSMAVTLGTVALFAQAYQLLFLLFGWSQAIRPAHEDERSDQLGSARQTTRQPAQMVIYT
jgi:cell division protein FtsW (lipid II flippase)